MWLLYFLFTSVTLLIGWLLFGYFLYLWMVGRLNSQADLEFPQKWPFISIIVPCLNEEKQIADKIKNLKALDYPRDRLEIVIADGGSSDQSLEIITSEISEDRIFRIEHCPAKGKINQLNFAIQALQGDIILNTDMDSRLSSDALKWICAEFNRSDQIKVVGAYCCPANTLDVEQYYWAAQNKGRFIENDSYASTIVIAQCYAFKKELLQQFPTDVVADDIYVAFLANTRGFKTVYSRLAKAVETRSPANYYEFIPHKFRKSNAFLRETIRFLYRLPEMPSRWKLMLVTRCFQQLLLPWVTVFWMMLGCSLFFLFQFDVVFFGNLFLGSGLLLTSWVFKSIELPDGKSDFSLPIILKGFSLTLMIMLLTGLTYPFFQQGSDYRRLSSESKTQARPSQKHRKEEPMLALKDSELSRSL